MRSKLAITAIASLLAAIVAAFPTAGVAAHSASHRAAPPATAITPNGAWPVYHHDDGHTGYDSTRPAATTASTGWASPGLDGTVYGEPLVNQGLVYVATLNNTVYALNQTDGSVVWSNHLRAPQASGWGCGNVAPQGILGTPVIDSGSGRIYVATLSGVDQLYRLEGLNLNTGVAEMSVVITTQPLSGFDWTIQQQRGALAVRNGYIYIPFGGRAGDCGAYHGWIFGVPIAGGAIVHYVTPGTGASFWAAGGVVVDDSTGKVFDTSGNGVSAGCSANLDGTPVYENDAVARFSATLVHEDAFIPQDWQANWCSNDQDLGSASMVLISPTLAFQAGKWGNGFLVNPQALGGMNGQLYPAQTPYSGVDVCHGNHLDANFGSYAYAAPYVYLQCQGNGLVGVSVNTGSPSFSACDATCAAPTWKTGGTTTFGPPIVAGGAVWAVDINGSGLYGFDATTGAQIYQSAAFSVMHFSTPSEAGGQIFVSSDTVVRSFTMVGGCQSVAENASPASPAAVGTPVQVTATASGCPNPSPRYEFWLLAPGASLYTLAQAYSTSAVFNWTTTGLTPGTYRINVWARDASSPGAFGNSSGTWDAYNANLTFTLTGCQSVSDSAAPPSAAMSGTVVAVTAAGSGCSNPQYEFWTLAPGAALYSLAQSYSTSAVFNWNTSGLAVGTYRINVWVRDSSSAGAFGNSYGTWDAYNANLTYTLTAGCPSVADSASPANAAMSGMTVTVTASSPGCPRPLYEFWVLAPGASLYTLAQGYGISAVLNWNTTSLATGTYRINVWVRDSSSAGVYGNAYGRWDTYNANLTYILTTGCPSVSDSASPPTSAAAGSTVTVTASAPGCPSPQYEFWILYPGASLYTLVQPYGSSATLSWNTTGLAKGTYRINVWVKDSSSAGVYGNAYGRWDTYNANLLYTLT
jgi:hypothetical protein